MEKINDFENSLEPKNTEKMPYRSLRKKLMKAGKWINYIDTIKIRNTIFREFENSKRFTIKSIKHNKIITNKSNDERIICLDARPRITKKLSLNADKKEALSTINDLLDENIRGTVNLVCPITTDNSHWTLNCRKVNLDELKAKKEEKRRKKEELTIDDLAKYDEYEVDSLRDGRQNDGYSCGIHTMDAVLEVCEHGFDGYKKIYNERCNKSTKGKNTKKPIKDTKKNQKPTNTKPKDNALIAKKEIVAKMLGLESDKTLKRFFMDSEFYDKDTVESIQGVLSGDLKCKENIELIRDIKSNIAMAMKEIGEKTDQKKVRQL